MIEKTLFRDVENIPIVSSPSQDLWLGIQIKADEHWETLLKLESSDSDAESSAIYACLHAHYEKLGAKCEELEIRLPNVTQWIAELLLVRRDIHELRRSRLRRFIRRTNKLKIDPADIESLHSLVYELSELLAMLSDELLRHLVDLQVIPLPEILLTWISQSGDPIRPLRSMVHNRSEEARHTLVKGYLRYALRMARNYVGQGIDYLDLVQEACLGLIRAARRFDYREQARFATYAATWIWQGLSRAVCEQGRCIRVPVYRQSEITTVRELYNNMIEESGRFPVFEDLLMRLDYLDEEDIKRIQRCRHWGKPFSKRLMNKYREAARDLKLLLDSARPLLSLEYDCEVFRNDMSNSYSIQSQVFLNSLVVKKTINKIRSMLMSFSDRDSKIFRMRFGLDTGVEHTLAELGEIYDLSRERIRQIEHKILVHLKSHISEEELSDCLSLVHWSFPCSGSSYLDPKLPVSREILPSSAEKDDYAYLDDLLDQLPGGDWHQRHRSSTREEQLVEAMRMLQEPAHYSDVKEQIDDLLGNEDLDEKYVYSLLSKYEGSFILLGEGVFSLVTWERKRAEQSEPVLPFCPNVLPNALERDQVFLESILVAKEIWEKELVLGDFLEKLLQWAGITEIQPTWLLQGVVSAYYTVGVLPYCFYSDKISDNIALTLPELGLQQLRRRCLQMMTKRLVAMPEFWWLLQRYEPARASDIAEHFVDIHPLGLDDTLNRLEMLTGIGATYKSEYSHFRLTSLGYDLANKYGKAPSLEEETAILSQSSKETGSDLFDLIAF